MTISEQLREAALYAEKPWEPISYTAFVKADDLCSEAATEWQTTQGRTFLLIVAEALE